MPTLGAAVGRQQRVLHSGTVAPDFALPDEEGRTVRLADQRGHWVLLWWYPKAATPG
jgi:peroxiredoxin